LSVTAKGRAPGAIAPVGAKCRRLKLQGPIARYFFPDHSFTPSSISLQPIRSAPLSLKTTPRNRNRLRAKIRETSLARVLGRRPIPANRDCVTLSARGATMTSGFARQLRMSAAAGMFLFGFSARLRAQETQLDTLAKQSAAALERAQKHNVVVLDFTGTDSMTALGEKLAADFRDALTRGGASALKVEDRDLTIERVTERGLELSHLRDPNTVRWVYGGTRVDSWISGTMSQESAGLKLSLELHSLGNVALIAELSAVIPLPPDMKALIIAPPRDEFASIPTNGSEGLTKAVCISCPAAVYSLEALKTHMTGTVILAFTINKHGHTKDVRVKQSLPDGLTQQAVDAVLSWKFTPAKNPKGKRVEVRQRTDIGFSQSPAESPAPQVAKAKGG
jgi:TonB family protein